MNLLDLIKETMEDFKANDITVVDFKNTSPLCDAFVICDAQSLTQVKAIAQAVERKVVDAGFDVKPQGNTPESNWLIVDALDVIAHIFTSEERDHYDLDKLYKEFIRE